MFIKLVPTSRSLFAARSTVQSSVLSFISLSTAFDTIDHPSFEILYFIVFQDAALLTLLTTAFQVPLMIFFIVFTSIGKECPWALETLSLATLNAPDGYTYSASYSDLKKFALSLIRLFLSPSYSIHQQILLALSLRYIQNLFLTSFITITLV